MKEKETNITIGKKFYMTRVVTKNFFRDWTQRVRSIFGMRQTAYEKKVTDTIKEMFDIIENGKAIEWYRMNQDVIGDAIIITIYGEHK